ncbi:hypothetical protein QQ045_000314 [Rhodiola kirilowii]
MRNRLQLAVFRSGLRLSGFASAAAPGAKTTYSTHPRPRNSPRSVLRAAAFSSLPRLSQTSNHDADGDLVFRFMQNFSYLVKEIEKNRRNFVALRRIDDVLKDVERLDCVCLVFVVRGLCRIRKLQRAKNVMMEMRRRVEFCDYFLYSVVFDCLVRDGRIDEVEIVWNEVCGKEKVIDFSGYVVNLCKFGDLSGIKRVCERILKDGKVLEDRSAIVETVVWMMRIGF